MDHFTQNWKIQCLFIPRKELTNCHCLTNPTHPHRRHIEEKKNPRCFFVKTEFNVKLQPPTWKVSTNVSVCLKLWWQRWSKTGGSIFSCPLFSASALWNSRIPLSWTFKDGSWPAFFTGTLTSAACIASLEQMQPEENKAGRPGG